MNAKYYMKSWISNLNVAVGSLGAVVWGIMLLNPNARGSAFGATLLVLFLGIWQKKSPIIELEEDHFKMKAAPLAGRKSVLYKSIVRLEEPGSNKAFLYFTQAGKETKLRLPLSSLAQEDAQAVLKVLRQQVTSNQA